MIPYMIGKLAPNSTHSTRGFVKYVPDRGCFRSVPSQNGDKFVTSPPATIVERVGYDKEKNNLKNEVWCCCYFNEGNL